MEKEEFMYLQHSESVVAQMAATIFSSLIARDTSYAIQRGRVDRKVGCTRHQACEAGRQDGQERSGVGKKGYGLGIPVELTRDFKRLVLAVANQPTFARQCAIGKNTFTL